VLTVIGCGNLARRDDGVGIVVAQRLAAALTPHERRTVTVIDAGTDGMGVMLRANGASALVLVDASRTGSAPGTIHEVPGGEIESAPGPSLNLHDFRWDHALYAGRQMHGESFPRDVHVFLIEVEDLSFGLGLSGAVEAAAGRVVETIRRRIAAAADGTPDAVSLLLRHGSLRLPRAVCERFFAGLDAVLLLPRGGDLLILPVHAAAGGGQLLKVINAAGDRAVSGVELFRAQGLDPELIDGCREASFTALWSGADAALIVERFFC